MATPPPPLPFFFFLIRAQTGARRNAEVAARRTVHAARCLGLPRWSEQLPHRPDTVRVSAGEEAKHRESARGVCQASGRMKRRFRWVQPFTIKLKDNEFVTYWVH